MNAVSVKLPSVLAVPVAVWPLGSVAVTVWPGVAPVPVTTPWASIWAVMPVVLGASMVAVSAGWPAEVGALMVMVSPLVGAGLNAVSVKLPSGLAMPVAVAPLGSVAVTT